MDLQRHKGTSGVNSISETIFFLIKVLNGNLKTWSVLDVGCGKGVYGYILKSYLSKLHMYGVDVEIPKSYSTILNLVYDKIYESSITDFKFEMEYDVVLLNHVIEHLPFKEAIEVIKTCKEHSKNIIIGLPKGYKNWEYKDLGKKDCFHSHKWGVSSFPSKELGFMELNSKYTFNKIFTWSKEPIIVNSTTEAHLF